MEFNMDNALRRAFQDAHERTRENVESVELMRFARLLNRTRKENQAWNANVYV